MDAPVANQKMESSALTSAGSWIPAFAGMTFLEILDIAMQTLTRQIIEADLANRVLSDIQLARLVEGSPQRRHSLVNRAIKAGELLRLRRGSYVLDAQFRDYPIHPFALAQAFVPGSYVSFETALAHHGWIPEAVYSTASVTPGRKSHSYEHPLFSSFTFHPLAIHDGYFLERVGRQQVDQQTFLLASPFRALMDLVCLRKSSMAGHGLADGGAAHRP